MLQLVDLAGQITHNIRLLVQLGLRNGKVVLALLANILRACELACSHPYGARRLTARFADVPLQRVALYPLDYPPADCLRPSALLAVG